MNVTSEFVFFRLPFGNIDEVLVRKLVFQCLCLNFHFHSNAHFGSQFRLLRGQLQLRTPFINLNTFDSEYLNLLRDL